MANLSVMEARGRKKDRGEPGEENSDGRVAINRGRTIRRESQSSGEQRFTRRKNNEATFFIRSASGKECSQRIEKGLASTSGWRNVK